LIHRQFRGSRAAELFPVLAYAPDQQLFILDDLSLGFGFVCEPLASADRAQADRLSVLMNLDWPAETLVQIALWASPDIEERLARMQALRIGRHLRCGVSRGRRRARSASGGPDARDFRAGARKIGSPQHSNEKSSQ
jgi:conjugal transfer ATP-binding protein TraC